MYGIGQLAHVHNDCIGTRAIIHVILSSFVMHRHGAVLSLRDAEFLFAMSLNLSCDSTDYEDYCHRSEKH